MERLANYFNHKLPFMFYSKTRRPVIGLSPVILFFVLISGCTKTDIHTPVGDASTQTTSPATDLVLTPFGYKLSSQVHLLPEGHALVENNGRLVEIDKQTKQLIRDYGVTVAENNPHGNTTKNDNPHGLYPSDNGWVTYAEWYNSSGIPIETFQTNWNVPSTPVANNGQTIFIFNAMQDGVTTTSHILQPVLQWGSSSAGGGSYWAVTNWYGSGSQTNGQYFHGALAQVSTGTTIQGVMSLTAVNGNEYSYTSSFSGYPASTEMTVNNAPQLIWAFETLECYGMQSESDYPNALGTTPYISMNNIQMLLNSGVTAPLDWTVDNAITDDDQHTVIVTQGAPNGIVDLCVGPTSVIIGSDIFGPGSTSGSGTIYGVPGTTVNVTISVTTTTGYYSLSCILSGATYTNGSSSFYVSGSGFNGTESFTQSFVMPAAGSVKWSGSLYTQVTGSTTGKITVQ